MRWAQIVVGMSVAAVLVTGCGPSSAEQASDRLAAAWEAADQLDATRAEAELRAADELSSRTVDPVREALERRIGAVRIWNAAEAGLNAGEYLAAIEQFARSAASDNHFAGQAPARIRAAEDAYVERALTQIGIGLDAESPTDAFEELRDAIAVFPDNVELLAVRARVAEANLPIVAEELGPAIQGEQPENARDPLTAVLAVLGADAPGAEELNARVEDAVAKAVETRRIAQQKERDRIAAEQRAAQEAAERARRAVFERIGCNRDDRERISRCYDRVTLTRTPTNRLYFWTFQADGQQPRLQLGLQTTGSRWIFFERARVYVDGRTYDIDAGYFNVNRDNSGRSTWETYSRRATSRDLEMMNDIANASEVYVRFINRDRQYREHRLTTAQITAVRNMAAYWKEVG